MSVCGILVAFMVACRTCVSTASASVGAAVFCVGDGSACKSRPGLRRPGRAIGRGIGERSKDRPAGRQFILAGLLAALSVVFPAANAPAVTTGAGAALAWIEAGAQPCADLCDAGWALQRMRGVMPQDVHAEFARRIAAGSPMRDDRVASGDVIVAVSYAMAGLPLVDLTRRVAQFPDGVQFPAHGHAVTHDGETYRFVRVDTWENWALIVEDAHPASAQRHDGPAHLAIPGIGGAIAGGGSGGGGGAGSPFALGPAPSDLLRPLPPAPIPLPGGLALLAGTLAFLGGCRLCRVTVRR